jgi:type II secretory pathway predicted ATPase ExeA
MYESYWDLRQKPFENNIDPAFYYPGETHQSALLKLRYAVESRRGAALLAGPAGTGKTMVIGMLRTMLGENFAPVVELVYPQMSAAELLAYLSDALQGSPSAAGTVNESVGRIDRFLSDNAKAGKHALVVVDEAHLLQHSHSLETLRLLLNLGGSWRPAMTLLLVGQPGILPVLDRTPQLEQRLDLKCMLQPLTAEETEDYVSHRFRAAGSTRKFLEPGAITSLYELTHGLPREINRLGDLALLIGFAEQQQTLTAAHFENVCRELVALAPE